MPKPTARRGTLSLAGIVLISLVAAPIVAAETPPQPPSGGPYTVVGSGATFPAPAYNSWFSKYKKTFKNAKVKFQYKGVGSGAGINAIRANPPQADWGASDLAMTNAELAGVANGRDILHVPTLLGAIVLGIRLDCTKKKITLTRENVGDLFSGAITRWNDAKLRTNGRNPTLNNAKCNTKVTPVHRSDSSGTTAGFTAFLDKCSTSFWAGKLNGPTKQYGGWPVGVAAPRNSGVALKVKQNNGFIGYMELAYAKQAKVKIARVQNAASNNFVTPNSSTTSAAANAVLSSQLSAHPDLRFDPVACASGFNSYPIVSFSFALLFKQEPVSAAHGKMLVSWFYWSLNTGQKALSKLGYAPLPTSVRTRSVNQLKLITFNGAKVWNP